MILYRVSNIADLLEFGKTVEDDIVGVLNSFHSRNKDTEDFIKNNAISFSKQGWSQTYIITASCKGEKFFVGYFTLSNKEFFISEKVFEKCGAKTTIKSGLRQKILNFGIRNDELGGYRVVSPLIAQLSKNYHNENNKLITGDELLEMACNKVREVHRLIGGKFVYLECENKQGLLNFYSSNNFVKFGERVIKDKNNNLQETSLIQMLKELKT